MKKEKAVYHTLNMLSVDVTRKCLVAEAWCPVSAKPKVKQELPPQVLDEKTPVYFVCVITSQNPYIAHPASYKELENWVYSCGGSGILVMMMFIVLHSGIQQELHVWLAIVSGDCVQIQDALQRAAYDSNSQVNTIFQVLYTKESPPTFFETNKFTSAFQEIVDAYG